MKTLLYCRSGHSHENHEDAAEKKKNKETKMDIEFSRCSILPNSTRGLDGRVISQFCFVIEITLHRDWRVNIILAYRIITSRRLFGIMLLLRWIAVW